MCARYMWNKILIMIKSNSFINIYLKKCPMLPYLPNIHQPDESKIIRATIYVYQRVSYNDVAMSSNSWQLLYSNLTVMDRPIEHIEDFNLSEVDRDQLEEYLLEHFLFGTPDGANYILCQVSQFSFLQLLVLNL